MAAPNPKTNPINELIANFAESIADYLMPKIVCVDPNNEFTKEIERNFTWVSIYNSAKEIPLINSGCVYILCNTAEELATVVPGIDRKQNVLILCQTDISDRMIVTTNALSVRLNNPSADSLLFQLKAVLAVKDDLLMYDPAYPIYSMQADYKDLLSVLISNIYTYRQSVVEIDDVDGAIAWYRFLFKSLPPIERPTIVNGPNQKPQPNTVLFIPSNDLDTVKQFKNDHNLIVFTESAEHFSDLLPDYPTHNLKRERLYERGNQVHHYLASLKASATLGFVRYSGLETNSSSLSSLSNQIIAGDGCLIDPPPPIKSFVNKSYRMSLPNIMDDLEFSILSTLKANTSKVAGFVTASGIQANTLHKKMSRLAERAKR